MKILVTGAGGYLGLGVVKQLLDDGLSVVATDFNIDGIDSRATIVKSNFFDVEDPYNFYGKPDILLHMAWRDGFIHSSDSHIGDLSNHIKFINKLVESGIEQICIMGSMHEVGFYEGSINEYTTCNPESMYGISKNALRHATKLVVKEKNTILQWLRAYYIVGTQKNGSSIFSKIVKAACKNEKEFPFTTGQNQYDFIDYDEFCIQVASVVSQKEINGVINICSGKPERLCDRVERFIEENNFDIKLKYGQFPDRPYDSKAVWGDNNKIKKIMYKRYNWL